MVDRTGDIRPVARTLAQFDQISTVARTVGYSGQNSVVACTSGQNDQTQIPTKIRPNERSFGEITKTFPTVFLKRAGLL